MATLDEITTTALNTVTAMRDAVTAASTSLSGFLTGQNFNSVGSMDFPTTPYSYAAFSQDDAALKQEIDTFHTDWSNITWPTLPSFPTFDATYKTPLWNDAAWSSLKTLLAAMTDTITSQTALDEVVRKLSSETDKMAVALYAKDYERKSQALRDAYSAADSSTGKLGFTFPNSMTTALKLDAQQKFQFDLSEVSRALVDRLFEWAKTNFQFSTQQRVTATNVDTDFNLKYMDTLVRAYAAEVASLVEGYKTQLQMEYEKVNTYLKEYGARVDAVKANAGINEAEDRNLIARYVATINQAVEAFKAQNLVVYETARNKISGYAALADSAARMAGAVSTVALGTIQQTTTVNSTTTGN